MDTSGWISLHRKIKEHWIWSNPSYLKAWIQMILDVNHDEKKVLIEGELIECNRGQSLKSINNWAKDFGHDWTIQKVRTFFKMLQVDGMISIEGLRKTTRVTLCKYDSYQNIQRAGNKQITSRQRTGNKQITTNNNDNNDNKYMFSLFYDSEIEKNKDADSKCLNEYKKFVAFLFGNNSAKSKLTTPLKMEKQVNFNQYCKLVQKSDYETICNKLYALQNSSKYDNKYKDLYMTLQNWISYKSK